MKKILFVSSNMDRGGAQRVLSILANEYERKGWGVHIAMVLNNKIGYELAENIKIHDLSKRGAYIKNLIPWVIDIRALIKNVQPDVIVSFVGRINVITMCAGIGLNIPIIISERNDPANDRRSNVEVALCKMFYSKADCVVFQTHYQKEFYQGYCDDNGVIIGNPISAPIYEGEHCSKDIIAVGKLMKQKNHPMLIKAFAEVSKKYPEKKVHIFGDGELQSDLEKLIASLELEETVILEGNIKDVFEQLHKHQYFVMCSEYEGLSNALLEAMLSGMTCISTNWCGVEDVIADGINGYIVPRDDVHALVEKLEYIFSGCTNEQEVCMNAIAKGKEYQTAQIIDKWYEVIESTYR